MPAGEICSFEDSDSGTYYVVAEKDDVGLIAIKENENSGQLYLIHTEDGSIQVLTNELGKSCDLA